MANSIHIGKPGENIGELIKGALEKAQKLNRNVDLVINREILIVVQPTNTKEEILLEWMEEIHRAGPKIKTESAYKF